MEEIVPVLLIAGLTGALLLFVGWGILRAAWKRKDAPMSAGRKVALVLLLVFGGAAFMAGLLLGACSLLYGGALLNVKHQGGGPGPEAHAPVPSP